MAGDDEEDVNEPTPYPDYHDVDGDEWIVPGEEDEDDKPSDDDDDEDDEDDEDEEDEKDD